MKRLRIVFGVSATAAFVSALAFVNNLVAIVRWWRAFLAAGGDSTHVAAHAPGWFAWLDWTAVDYSAVTTLIPLIGFTCMAVGARKLICGRLAKPDSFPFFDGSDQLYIALGLFGTLWGIIVIGYFKLETVTMADLMQCLHTALFSTLMAVVWVFLVDRTLVRPFFRRLLAESGLVEVEDGDLAAAVDCLVRKLHAASDAFDRRQREFESAFVKRDAEYAATFERRNEECAATMEKRNAAYAEAFEKRNAAYAEAFEKRLADYQSEFESRQKEYVEFFTRRIAELEKRAAESADRLKAVAAALHS